ncbi:di-heme oxidoredictase family protein [Pseudoalteromonas phenolica]|uniref:di-heme oxidoreductase family protein n=1 Tax=Pseudoalteromonas phenolica TaxID=161398 RepID=UPI00110A1917|nr:di-heme oxidoredictase family protein [Pseudoalteromonas phenolica]TMO55615.1 hypothetical protein CWC21_09200 [Pseudoalteromonas phenolica]
MMLNLQKSSLIAATIICLSMPVNTSASNEQAAKPGGDATGRLNYRSFVEPAKNIPRMEQLDFWDGFSFFRDPWVASPSITRDRDGLGPLFNARSCKTCHADGGRGRPSKHGEIAEPALLFRFLQANASKGDSRYGGQLQPLAIRLSHEKLTKPVQGEAQVRVFYEEITGHFADGETYTLRKPRYEIENLAYGPLDKGTYLSARYAPAVYGMGLLDAIQEKDLLNLEDINDANKDGISGKYNQVIDAVSGKKRIGRFGFKGLHSTLEQQVAGAFVNDIGITNPIFKDETCLVHQVACKQAGSVDPEHVLDIPEKLHDLTVYMSQLIAPPPARDLQSSKSKQGQTLFYKLQCQQCHTPSFTTDTSYQVKALAGQTIWPYTDLALHDMGEGLADKGVENLASGSEWRTPPLWGIGLQHRVQGFSAFLHDGRARTIEEAVLWHGGEAQPHQQKFKSLTKQQRAALLYFLKQI